MPCIAYAYDFEDAAPQIKVEEGARLTASQVFEIRKLALKFDYPFIASIFKTTPKYVQMIVERKRWKHI